MISEKKLITDLEKMKKCMFLLNFENFKKMIFTFSTEYLLQFRSETAKKSHEVEKIIKRLLAMDLWY